MRLLVGLGIGRFAAVLKEACNFCAQLKCGTPVFFKGVSQKRCMHYKIGILFYIKFIGVENASIGGEFVCLQIMRILLNGQENVGVKIRFSAI
jgi:hypothetical protein